MMIMEEEGPIAEVAALDQAMQIDEEDEEQALLMAASQGMTEERRAETSPFEQEWLEFRSGGLVIGKNFGCVEMVVPT